MRFLSAILIAAVLSISSAASAANRNLLTSGSWTAIGTFADGATTDGVMTPNDTLTIPAGLELTINPGDTVDFATGTGYIINNGTLNQYGTLKVYNNLIGTGVYNFVGTLNSCVTSGTSCTVADQTPALGTYGLGTLSTGGRQTNGWRLTYASNAWDGGFAAGDIIEFMDIDGNPANDSPAGALRPFFNVGSVSDASNYIQTDYRVGSSGTLGSAPWYREGQATIAADCYVGDYTGAGAGVEVPDRSDSDGDSSELDQNWAAAANTYDARSTSISLPTGTLTNNQDHDFEGQWICLGAAAADARCYLIWSSTDGGVGRDIVRVWPPIRSQDYTVAAKTCTIGWGEPNRTAAGTLGLPLAEFIGFTPAQLLGNRAGVKIVPSGSGQVNMDFTINGAKSASAGYAVSIYYSADSVIDSKFRHSWFVGGSTDSLIGGCDGSYIQTVAGGVGTITIDHVSFSHDFEPRDCTTGTGAAGDDTTSGIHGIAIASAVNLVADRLSCFNIGDTCAYNESATGASVFTLSDISCGWMDGQSTSCAKWQAAAHTANVSDAYVVNVPSKQGVCTGAGTTPLPAGTRCAANADCAAASGVCIAAAQPAFIYDTASRGEVRGIVGLSSDTDGAYVSDQSTTGTNGSTLVNVTGGFILDDRTDKTVSSGIVSAFTGVNSVKNVSAPFATTPGSNIVSTFSSNYFARLRNLSGTYGVLTMFGAAGANGPSTIKIENNSIMDVYDASAIPAIGFFLATIPDGSKLYVRNNQWDRSRAGGVLSFVNLASKGDAFAVPANGELIRINRNVVGGYSFLAQCDNPAFPATTADIEVNGNAFAPSSAAVLRTNGLVSYGCTQSLPASRFDALTTIVPRLRTLGGGISSGAGGNAGPQGIVGAKQSPWMTSLGITSQWISFGGTGGGGDAPCLGSACSIPSLGSN